MAGSNIDGIYPSTTTSTLPGSFSSQNQSKWSDIKNSRNLWIFCFFSDLGLVIVVVVDPEIQITTTIISKDKINKKKRREAEIDASEEIRKILV